MVSDNKADKAEIGLPLSTTLGHFISDGTDSEFRKMIYGLLKLSSLMLRAREFFAAHIGLSAPQYSMLVAIAETKEATAGDLAEALHTSSPFITTEMKKLVRIGYVAKRVNEADRRSTLLSLTELGKTRVRQVGPMREAANDMIFGSLNPAEAAMLQHLIRVLIRDAERAVHALDGPQWREPAVAKPPKLKRTS